MSETIFVVNHNDTQRVAFERVIVEQILAHTVGFRSISHLLRHVEQNRLSDPDIVILDGVTSRQEAREAINAFRSVLPEVPLMLMAPFGEDESSLLAYESGVDELLTKPVNVAQIKISIQQCIKMKHMRRYITWLEHAMQGRITFSDLVGVSSAFAGLCAEAQKAAESNLPIWIEGERGVGKELFARAIAGSGRYAGKPFVVASARILNESDDLSALFGRDGIKPVRGKLREAQGGTLVISDIDLLSLPQQTLLLSALEKGEFFPVDAAKPVPFDVRLCALSLYSPTKCIENGATDATLARRLATLSLHISPLRDRPEDALALAEHYMCLFAAMEGKHVRTLSEDAKAWLKSQVWRRNVHELEQMMRRAVMVCDALELSKNHMTYMHDSAWSRPVSEPNAPATFKDENGKLKKLKHVEAELILHALEINRGCMTRAARELGIGRSTLYRKLEEQRYQARPHHTTLPTMSSVSSEHS